MLVFLAAAALAGGLTVGSALDVSPDRWSRAGQTVVKFGRNPSCGTTTEDVWLGGDTFTGWLTAAASIRVASGGNAADTAAGAGCREVTFECLDSEWDTVTQSVATAGASASSAGATTCIRVQRAWCSAVGTYTGANTGAMTIETTGGTVVAVIAAGGGQTQQTMYTVPDGYRAWVTGGTVSVDATGSNVSRMRFWQRRDADDVSAPYAGTKRVAFDFDGVKGMNPDKLTVWSGPFPARTDLWASCTGSANVAISVHYEMILEPVP